MAQYFADSVNGNDANPGTFASPKATYNGVMALGLVSGDEVFFRAGTYTVSAQAVAASITVSNYQDEEVIFTGAQNMVLPTSTSGVLRFEGIIFRNHGGVNGSSGAFTISSTSWHLQFESCTFDNATPAYTNARFTTSGTWGSLSVKNCRFLNYDIAVYSGSGDITFLNCYFENCGTSTTAGNAAFANTGTSVNWEFFGCTFRNCRKIVDLSTGTTTTGRVGFDYCTIYGTLYGGTNPSCIFEYRGSANNNIAGKTLRISNSLIQNIDRIIYQRSTGVLALDGILNYDNWIASGVDRTNFTSVGDITSEADALFYNAANGDFRLEATSGAAVGNNGLTSTRGSTELESPETFFTSIVESKVENGYAYKQKSRTNNKTGSLSGYPLLALSNVKIGVDRGDTQLGTYDGSDRWTDPGESNVKSGVAYKANSTSNNKTGNRTDAAAANVLIGTTQYGANGTEFTPAYSPDFPERANVAPDDTVNGLAGTMDLPALSSVDPLDTLRGSTGTMDVPALNKVAPSDTLRGVAGTLDLPALNKVAPSDTLEGVSGTMDLPSLSSIDPADTLEGVAGTMDLPALNKVAPSDTLKGQAGTMDIPALNKVAPSDTLEGVAGTMDLPSINNVNTTDTLEGVSGGLVVPVVGDVKLNTQYGPGNSLTGELTATADYPPVSKVLSGTEFDSGNLVGTLGDINTASLDIAKQMANNAKTVMATTLGNTFKELDYFKEVEKNNFNANSNRYGIRALTDTLTKEKIGDDTLDLEFEIKLTTDFTNRDGDDKEREAELLLIEKMEAIRRALRVSKFGFSSNVRIFKEFNREEPEKLGTNLLMVKALAVVSISVKNS